jgi:hypothetical protein
MNDSLLERAISDRRDAVERAERAEAEVRALREAAQLTKNVLIYDGERLFDQMAGIPSVTFTGQWVAVPRADFDALRAALDPKP